MQMYGVELWTHNGRKCVCIYLYVRILLAIKKRFLLVYILLSTVQLSIAFLLSLFFFLYFFLLHIIYLFFSKTLLIL